MDTLAHECTHAALEYCRRRHRINFDKAPKRTNGLDCNEEYLAYAVGHMTGQIATHMVDAGYEFDYINLT